MCLFWCSLKLRCTSCVLIYKPITYCRMSKTTERCTKEMFNTFTGVYFSDFSWIISSISSRGHVTRFLLSYLVTALGVFSIALQSAHRLIFIRHRLEPFLFPCEIQNVSEQLTEITRLSDYSSKLQRHKGTKKRVSQWACEGISRLRYLMVMSCCLLPHNPDLQVARLHVGCVNSSKVKGSVCFTWREFLPRHIKSSQF